MKNIKKKFIIYNNQRPVFNFIGLFLIILNINLFCKSVSSFQILNNLNNLDNKCLWIENDLLIDTTSIDSILNFAVNNEINKIFLKVRDNGEAYYKSNITYNYELEFDPLEYVIDQSKKLNLKIFAWMDMYKLWSKNTYPSQPVLLDDTINVFSEMTHYYYQCPECLESDINGKSDRYLKLEKLQSIEWDGVYLSPIHPQVNTYLLSVVEELLNNYSVDGIYLDYLQYQNFYFGYNEDGIYLFEELYGFNPKDINRGLISTDYGYSEEEVLNVIKSWDIYRSDKITELVQYISNYCKLNHPQILIAVGANENLYESQNRWFQHWDVWLENDYIDLVVLKNNSNNFDDFIYNIQLIEKKYLNDNRKKIVINFTSNQSSNIIADKIFYLRLNQFSNVGVFSENFSINELDWYSPIFNTMNFEIK